MENNLIEFNGKHPQWGEGIYTDGKNIIIRNNIVRYNSSVGLNIEPERSNSIIENNLVSRNHSWAIWMVSGGNNRIVNNTVTNNGMGISIGSGYNDVIVNNIIWKNGDRDPIKARKGSDLKKVKMDYNLLLPTFSGTGPHSISKDPLFWDVKKGVYYLKGESPAIGKASPIDAPSKDFFGRKHNLNEGLDMGCYQYDSFLLLPEAREGWFGGWPYRYSKADPPDLWAFPASRDKETGNR